VTGHRAEVLSPEAVPRIEERVRDVLRQVEESGRALLETERDCFGSFTPRMRFVSPIADGADQIAAEAALALGWELEVVLPFDRNAYRASLATDDSRRRFDSLMGRASCLLELPGDPDQGLDAYVMTGRATVAHCDVLIAVRDGLPPRGRGGTGEVVQLALTRGTAIIHVPLTPGGDTRILWSAFDPTVLTVADDPSVARSLERTDVDRLLRALLMPPPDDQEQDYQFELSVQYRPALGAAVAAEGGDV